MPLDNIPVFTHYNRDSLINKIGFEVIKLSCKKIFLPIGVNAVFLVFLTPEISTVLACDINLTVMIWSIIMKFND